MTAEVNVEKSKSRVPELDNRAPHWARLSFVLMPTDGERKGGIFRRLLDTTSLRAA